jgi:flagellar hook-associated protein 1 FlgK
VADLLSTGVSGLRAFQRALDTTGHNIANASTPGYSRQRVELTTRVPDRLGSYFLGSGVDLSTVERVYDSLLTGQLRGATSTLARLDTYASKASTLNSLFSDSTTGISSAMQRFTNALQGVSNEPTSTAARQVMLSEANVLRQRLQSYDNRLTELNGEINTRLRVEADAINIAADGIAKLNEQIVSQASLAGAASGDLLDARDRLITELSGHLSVSVTEQDDGAWNVFVGNGQSLVVGTRAVQFATKRDAYDPERLVIAYNAGSGSADLSSSLSGGSLGGLLDFRRELLDSARNELGRIATGLASAANTQHRAGMDLYGNLGGDLFSLGAAEVLPEGGNGGSATVAVTRSNIGALTAVNYQVDFDGSAWRMRRMDTGATITMTGAGTVASPFVADGLSLVVSGAAAAGDSFLVRPTVAAVRGLSVLITDPSRVAAAAPIRGSAAITNGGDGTISAGEVLDAANPQLRSGANIDFISATQYSINGTGAFTYTPGAAIDANGWRVRISGAPAAGDRFTVTDNAGGTGDNRNMLALSDALSRGVFSAGTESISGAVTRLVGTVGVATNQARTGAEAQQVIASEVQASIDSSSGVNLDEEAANMMRYQQAYQAAAQIIRITQDMFDSLMRATGR